MYTDYDYSMADIGHLYDLANPEDWADPDDVYPALRSAGISFGIPALAWDILAASNGIDH